MKVSLFLDRFRLQSQENRERGKGKNRTLDDVKWEDIIPKIKGMKGRSIRVKNGRHFALVNAWKIADEKRPYVLIEGGIFSPGRKPAQWKSGEEEVKLVELKDGHEWIHPSWIVIPLNGNQLILQATRNGPHIGDIAWWVKKMTGVNYVAYDAVPTGTFYDGLTAGGKWKKVILDLRRKPGATGSRSVDYHESELADNIGAGKISIVYEPVDEGWFTTAKVKEALARYVPGMSRLATNSPNERDTLKLEDCTVVPQEDTGNPTDVLSFTKGMRRLVFIEVDKERVIKRTQIDNAMHNELISWLGEE